MTNNSSPLRRLAPWLLILMLAAFPLFAPQLGLAYYVGFVRRLLIIMIAAQSLNFLIGTGGMVALGHAGFMGAGAYVLIALSDAGVDSAWLLWLSALIGSGLVAALIGAVALRTQGVYFIMITLAFAQMLYYVAVSLRRYGGDDGYTMLSRPLLGTGLGVAEGNTLYWWVLIVVVMVFVLLSRVSNSRYGKALTGIRHNETRMHALGYPVYALKLCAFSATGALAGLSGALLVTHNAFVSPSMMHWSQSATMIVMLVIGGIGRRWGALVGVLVWMGMEEIFRQWTEYWHWPLGALLIGIVIYAPEGISAWLGPRALASRASTSGRVEGAKS